MNGLLDLIYTIIDFISDAEEPVKSDKYWGEEGGFEIYSDTISNF